nr:ejaculatory bulb-specific protein 3-like [Danaus plexippus plexippus]
MKVVIILATLITLVLTQDTYSSDLENFDIDELLENDRLLESYGKCLEYKGPCTSQGREFRKLMPEAIRTNCLKCTLKQREMVRKAAKALNVKLPKIWNELVKQEDPKGEYKQKFEDFLQRSD